MIYLRGRYWWCKYKRDGKTVRARTTMRTEEGAKAFLAYRIAHRDGKPTKRLKRRLDKIKAQELAAEFPDVYDPRHLADYPDLAERFAACRGKGPDPLPITAEVARLTREGMSTRAIATRLACSETTVRHHQRVAGVLSPRAHRYTCAGGCGRPARYYWCAECAEAKQRESGNKSQIKRYHKDIEASRRANRERQRERKRAEWQQTVNAALRRTA